MHLNLPKTIQIHPGFLQVFMFDLAYLNLIRNEELMAEALWTQHSYTFDTKIIMETQWENHQCMGIFNA